MENIAIVGQGAIGTALADSIRKEYPKANINIFSRKHENIDYYDEYSIAAASEKTSELNLVIVATGILHTPEIKPEKSIKDINPENLQKVYYINTILPLLIAKYFMPKLSKKDRAIFTAISARVGSISDNRLGGWYAYRASKAALNMVMKNLAVEFNRFNKNIIVAGLHPGTVASNLSAPFQANVTELFTPEYSAGKMLEVINQLSSSSSGKCFAWDGSEILA